MIVDRLNTDLKNAMLSGDKILAGILRNLKSAILYEQVAQGKRDGSPDDEMIVKVLAKEQKKRNDAILLYEKASDKERLEKEQFENEVIAKYLPKPASEEEIEEAIVKFVQEKAVSMDEPQSMGMIIGGVKSSLAGSVDGALLAQKVKQYIQENK